MSGPSPVQTEYPCPNCGHSDRMHVKGLSPQYVGCMVRGPRTDARRRPLGCPCTLVPDFIRTVAAR
jgi:hypothetical protein